MDVGDEISISVIVSVVSPYIHCKNSKSNFVISNKIENFIRNIEQLEYLR